MNIFGRFGSKFKETNEALAAARKSWRDEKLEKREQTAVEREKQLSARELEVAEQLREIQKLESRRWLRRLATTALLLVVSPMSFFVGVSVGSSPSYNSNPNSDASSGDGASAVAGGAETTSIATSKEAQGAPIPVWSDPQARYTDEGSGELPNGNLWSITRREGSSGISFSKREINCAGGTFRYLGEGPTLSTINDSADPSLGPLTSGSISTIVSDYACRKHGRESVAGI